MAETRDQTTVIGPDARFKGDLTFVGAGRILGQFEGTIEAQGELLIGPGAVCHATIQADTIIIDGRVQGDLIARDRLQLTGKANLHGDVTAAALVVAEGATFIGRCAVGPEALASAGRDRAAQAPVSTLLNTPAEPKPARTAPRPKDADRTPEPASSDWLGAGAPAPRPAWLGTGAAEVA